MKIMVALLMTASLMACGGKAKKNATPANATGTTDTTDTTTTDGTSGTGGSTYGGTQTTPPPAGTEPAAGGQ
jgi:hypothetical protein